MVTEMSSDNQKLVSSLCQQLHSKGHALIPGTGYAIKEGEQVFIPPGELHLDRVVQEDVFTFNIEFDTDGNPELSREAASPCHNISAYTNLYLRVFQEFDCGCVIYAQPTSAMVISEIFSKHFKIRNNQLITQISNGETKEQYPWTHELKVPIIDNPDDQTKLFDKLEDAFTKNPETNAVIVKGNGLIVCGDTWQEAKLMFETLLQLFDVAQEMRKVGISRVENGVAPVTRKAAPPKKVTSKDTDSEIAVVHESKPASKKPTIKPYVAKKPAVPSASLPTDIRTRMAEDRHKAEALKRKKLALTRLRQDRLPDTSQRRPMPSHRRDAASFMNNMASEQVIFGSMDNSMNSMSTSSNGMNNSMNGMNNSLNAMNQMNMNQPMNMDQQMMMTMMMNQNMMEQQFMGGNNMMNNMPMEMGPSAGNGSAFERALRRSSPGVSRGRGGVRGRSLRPAPGGAVRKSFASRKGPVKERLGFKSNITVDPSLLNDGAVNEEDY